jgi:site-specific recombinase XerD
VRCDVLIQTNSKMKNLSDFDGYLRRRSLLANTRRSYKSVLTRALPDPVKWYGRLVEQRPPTGTIQQARTAVAHWLRMNGEDEASIKAKLPPAKGRKSEQKRGLSTQALAAYVESAGFRDEPVRTILLLLPKTGLRISELCGLKRSSVINREYRLILSFRGKGDKHRIVPLGAEGAEILAKWMVTLDPSSEVLFPGRRAGRSVSAWSVQEACRQIRDENPVILPGLTPHILRHTYATRAVVAGVDLASLKALLGHDDIKTTQRYLNPSVDDLTAAVDGVEGI